MDKSNLEVVTSHHLFLDNQYEKIDEDGLLSQRIFGPKLSYKCACGYYSSKFQHAGQRCPKCGVLCCDNFARYTTFAKIILPFPIFKITNKNEKILKGIVGSYKYLIDVRQINLTTVEKLYLQYDIKHDKLKIVNEYDFNNCIPLVITGLYSLYIALCAVLKTYNSKKAKFLVDKAFTYELLVIPPESRPVHKQLKNNQVTVMVDEINKYYSQILDLSQYDWSILGINPTELKNNFVNMICQSIYDQPIESSEMVFYDSTIIKYQKYASKIYKTLTDKLSSKNGIIRRDFLGKSIDFCSRTHVVVDPSLKVYEIKIPKANFLRLFFIEYIYFLIKLKNIASDEVLMTVKLTENKTIFKYPQFVDEFIEWMFSDQVDYHKRLVLINRQPT